MDFELPDCDFDGRYCKPCNDVFEEDHFYMYNLKDGKKNYRCKLDRTLKSQQYRKTEKGKLTSKKAVKQYSKTEKGKLAHKKAFAKYSKTEKGKSTHKKAADKSRRKNLPRYIERIISGREKKIHLGREKKNNHKLAKYQFNLSHEKVKELCSTTHCCITGVELSTEKGPYSASLDRIDSNKGYTDANVRIVCLWANLAKSKHTDEIFVKFCKLVAKKIREGEV